MPSGFRGTQVAISSISIAGKDRGAQISVSASFMDGDGMVHATTRHTLEAGADPKIAAAAKALYEALQRWVESVHYTDPTSASSPRVNVRGIAETIRDADDESGEPGRQG